MTYSILFARIPTLEVSSVTPLCDIKRRGNGYCDFNGTIAVEFATYDLIQFNGINHSQRLLTQYLLELPKFQASVVQEGDVPNVEDLVNRFCNFYRGPLSVNDMRLTPGPLEDLISQLIYPNLPSNPDLNNIVCGTGKLMPIRSQAKDDKLHIECSATEDPPTLVNLAIQILTGKIEINYIDNSNQSHPLFPKNIRLFKGVIQIECTPYNPVARLILDSCFVFPNGNQGPHTQVLLSEQLNEYINPQLIIPFINY